MTSGANKMKTYILTDLTRFSNPDMVCIALVDPETGECFRPLPYLTSKACSDLDIQPGAKISGELTLCRERHAPHIEDANYGNLKFAGASTAQEFRSVLEKTLSPDVSEGFGVVLENNQKHIPNDSFAQRSILTIAVDPRQITIHEDQYKPGKIKLSFQDGSGHSFRYLPITDRGFYDFAEKHQHDSELQKV